MFWTTIVLCAALATSSTSSSGKNLTPHIHDGHDAKIEEVPYILSLRVNGRFQHGAVIINPSWALTVATSIGASADGIIVLRAGSALRDAGGTLHSVIKKVVHPQYSHESIDYNYALLQVEQPFMFSSTVAAATLPRQGEEVLPYTKAVVSGWGLLNSVPEGSFPHIQEEIYYSMNLKSGMVTTLSDKTCQMLNYWTKLTPRMLCANFVVEQGNPCVGDRGDALVVDGKLIGMAVTEICDVTRKSANVYSKISDQRNWIDSVVNNHGPAKVVDDYHIPEATAGVSIKTGARGPDDDDAAPGFFSFLTTTPPGFLKRVRNALLTRIVHNVLGRFR